MFSIFQLDFPPNHISYLFPPVQLHVLICHFPSANFPLPFSQSSNFLRPICHFPSPNLSLPFSAFFNRISIRIIFHICFPLSNCMCPIGHFLSPNFPLPCYTFFLNWLNFTFNFFQTVQRIFTNYFQVLQYPGAQTTACKAQHSQGCNVFYKIVNCHLCWKAFSPRHLHFGGCCTLESWLTSSRNSCRSEVADILHKIQTAQWSEPCRESAMQGNGCWEEAKKTDSCLNNMLVKNRGGTLCVPASSHLIRFAPAQCCTVHTLSVQYPDEFLQGRHCTAK